MHPLIVGYLRRTAIGVAVIAVGVPMLQNGGLTVTSADVPAITVSGDVSGLVAGRPSSLRLRVHNEGTAPVVVRHLTTTVRQQVAGCTLTVAPWTGALGVPGGGTAAEVVAVRLRGPRCAGASWTLDYSATS